MKLFIGNLSYDTSESELREIFAEFEPILELVRPINRETGQPRGFAFITLKDEETGEEAIEKLNGAELGGRQLAINEAEDRGGPRPPRQRYRSEEEDITSGAAPRVDDRPVDKKGNKVRYKSI
ncbi:MAG: RNA-binding protein [Verrucomicrobiota bacterium]